MWMLILQVRPGIRLVSVDVVMSNQIPRLTSPTFCLTRGGETWLNPARSHCGRDGYPRVWVWGSCWSGWKINPLSNEKYGPPATTPHVLAGAPPSPVGKFQHRCSVLKNTKGRNLGGLYCLLHKNKKGTHENTMHASLPHSNLLSPCFFKIHLSSLVCCHIWDKKYGSLSIMATPWGRNWFLWSDGHLYFPSPAPRGIPLICT